MPSAAGFAGVAVAGVSLFAAGLWHYGGHTTVGANATINRCQGWWSAIEQHSDGVCKRAAQAAIPPAVLIALAAGIVGAGLVAAVLQRRRRRNEASINDLRSIGTG